VKQPSRTSYNYHLPGTRTGTHITAVIPVLSCPVLPNNVVCRYTWPLTVGRGSMRGAEDEHDQVSALEILTIVSLLGNFFYAFLIKGNRMVPYRSEFTLFTSW
jgi:hypothetical protein